MSCADHDFDSKGIFSEIIYACADFIRNKGFSINMHSNDLPDNIAGRISYNRQEIKLNSNQGLCAGCAAITITHEAGHMLHFFECGDDEDIPSNEVREIEADRRGWILAKSFGLDSMISESAYKERHK